MGDLKVDSSKDGSSESGRSWVKVDGLRKWTVLKSKSSIPSDRPFLSIDLLSFLSVLRGSWVMTASFHPFGPFTLKLNQAVWFLYQIVHLHPLKIKTGCRKRTVRDGSTMGRSKLTVFGIPSLRSKKFYSGQQSSWSILEMTLWIDDVTGRKT